MHRGLLGLSLIALLFLLTGCGAEAAADLSEICVNGLQIGDPIDGVVKKLYRPLPEESTDAYTLRFREWRIRADAEGCVDKIFAVCSAVELLAGEGVPVFFISEIDAALGLQKTGSSWFNYEQRLRKSVFCDKTNDLRATFVFAEHDGSLVFLILERIC